MEVRPGPAPQCDRAGAVKILQNVGRLRASLAAADALHKIERPENSSASSLADLTLAMISHRTGRTDDAAMRLERSRSRPRRPGREISLSPGCKARIDTLPSPRFPETSAPPFPNMKTLLSRVFVAAVFAGGVLFPAGAGERVAAIPEDAFESLLGAVKPQAKESPWREIAWVTNITDARRRAVAEGKPLVIFTAADGSPLGRT